MTTCQQPQNLVGSKFNCLKVMGYLELYDFIYVYIYATKPGILKS